jgi:hypothetical protein
MPNKTEHIRDAIEIFADGIPINPDLRPGFDSTPNEQRDSQEVSAWWNKPYILTRRWCDMSETWDKYSNRAKESDFEALPQDVYEADLEQRRLKWFESWSSGIRYDVRCLNGGAWDRSSNLGMYPTLEDALAVCKSYTPTDYGMY